MIRVFLEFGISKSALAREYNVHVDTIRNIDRGLSFSGSLTRRKDRKMSDVHIKFIRAQAALGYGEHVIVNDLYEGFAIEVSRSTVRQVIAGKSYKDVK